jgi:hypothetical protein
MQRVSEFTVRTASQAAALLLGFMAILQQRVYPLTTNHYQPTERQHQSTDRQRRVHQEPPTPSELFPLLFPPSLGVA